MRMGWSVAAIVAILASFPAIAQSPARAASASFDGNGYRIERYRAPVDREPIPARRITLKKALRLHQHGGALFVDVLPVESGHRYPATGVWKLIQRHATIPGAIWHPEAGRGKPDPVLWQALLGAVQDHRKHQPKTPIIVFCRTDCWMGWNAARRLALAGVGQVYWLAEGVDGWHTAGRTLVDARPITVAP